MTENTHTTCENLLSSLSDFIDGELSDDLCLEIQKHIEQCDNCRIIVNTTRKTIDLVHASTQTKSGVPDDVRNRLFKRLNLDDYLKPSTK